MVGFQQPVVGRLWDQLEKGSKKHLAVACIPIALATRPRYPIHRVPVVTRPFRPQRITGVQIWL